MPLNNQIQIRRRVKLNIIKVNPLDINHIENSQCRLGWWYAYMAQVCTCCFVYLKSTNFFSHLNSNISPWCHERDWCPASLKAKKKYHKSKGNNCIGNILQGHPVDTVLKLKLNVPAAHKKKQCLWLPKLFRANFCRMVKRFNNRFCHKRTAIPSRIFKTQQTHIAATVGYLS